MLWKYNYIHYHFMQKLSHFSGISNVVRKKTTVLSGQDYHKHSSFNDFLELTGEFELNCGKALCPAPFSYFPCENANLAFVPPYCQNPHF